MKKLRITELNMQSHDIILLLIAMRLHEVFGLETPNLANYLVLKPKSYKAAELDSNTQWACDNELPPIMLWFNDSSKSFRFMLR